LTGNDKDGNLKYLISKKMMADIWARLRDRLASIESSTSMLEVTPDYAAHFFDMYVKNHDGKHMTGDRIKILLLNLPFMLRDLVSPEVITCSSIIYIYSIVYDVVYNVVYDVVYDFEINIVYDVVYDIVYDIVYDEFFDVDISFQFLQIHLINKAIQTAKQGSPFYKLPLITDPSEKIVETHVAALKWHMQSRKFEMTA
jgi:hypothetical protein